MVIAAGKKDWCRLKRLALPVFILYLCAVLGITIFSRLPFDRVRANFELFWSYRRASENRKLLWEIILNYFMLLPYGLLAPLYMKKPWALVSGFLFSAGIELAQYFMRRGLFEYDDIVGNTLGVLLGIGLFALLSNCAARQKK